MGVGTFEYKGRPVSTVGKLFEDTSDLLESLIEEEIPVVTHSSLFYGIAFGTYYKLNQHLYLDLSWRIRALTDTSTEPEVLDNFETSYAFHTLSSFNISLAYVF